MRYYKGEVVEISGNYNVYDYSGRIIGAAFVKQGSKVPFSKSINFISTDI